MLELVNKYDNIDKIKEEEINKILCLIDILCLIIKKLKENSKNNLQKTIDIFKIFEDSDNISLRTKISKCLLDLLRYKKQFLFEDYEYFFCFFFDNYRLENYYLNLSGSEFFLFLIENFEKESNPIEESDTKDFNIVNHRNMIDSYENNNKINDHLSAYLENNLKE